MDHDFWRERWASGQTGWHEPQPNASLRKHRDVLALGPGKRVLAPLSGKSADLTFLAETGAEVIGSELVESAALAYFTERGLATSQKALSDGTLEIASDRVRILVGDFFALTPAEVGPIDAVYDRAALVALPAELRRRYPEQLRRLAPRATLLTVTFVHDAAGGPPFSVDGAELASLFGAVEPLGELDVLASGGLAARGASHVRELTHLVRL